MAWSNGVGKKTHLQPVLLQEGGALQSWNDKEQRFEDTPPTLTVEGDERQWSRRFRVFVLQPGGYDKAAHNIACKKMAPIEYNCFANAQKNTCWFFVEFQPEFKEYSGKLAPLPDGNGWCRLITERQELPAWPDGLVPDSGPDAQPDFATPDVCAKPGNGCTCVPSNKVATYNVSVARPLTSLAYSPAGPRLLGGGNQRYQRWNTQTGQTDDANLPENEGQALFIFDVDGRLLLPLGLRNRSVLWNFEDSKVIHTYEDNNSLVNAQILAAHPTKGAEFAFRAKQSNNLAQQLHWIDPSSNVIKAITPDDPNRRRDTAQSLAFSPDGNTLAAHATRLTANSNANEFMLFWRWGKNGPEGEQPVVISVESGTQSENWLGISYHPSSRWLAVGRRNETTEILEVNGTNIVSKFNIAHKQGDAQFVSFQPKGGLLAIGTNEGKIEFYQIKSATETTLVKTIETGIEEAIGMVWRADGNELAIFSENRIERWACED